MTFKKIIIATSLVLSVAAAAFAEPAKETAAPGSAPAVTAPATPGAPAVAAPAATPAPPAAAPAAPVKKKELKANKAITGGVTLAGKTLAVAGNVATFDSSTDPTWSTATFTARYAVIYDDTPATDATKPLLAYIDFGADLSPSNGSLVITFNASGIFTMTAS